MIPNPWVIVGAGIFWVLSIGFTWNKAATFTQNAMAAAALQTTIGSIRKFNLYSAEDLETARVAAEARGWMQLKAQQIQHEFEMEVAHGALIQTPPAKPGDPPAPAGPVLVSDNGMRLLNAAIDLYHASAATAGGSGNPVPPDAAPRPTPGRPGAATTVGLDLKSSRYLCLPPQRSRGVATQTAEASALTMQRD